MSLNHYRKVVFTHANLKQPLHLVAGTIAGWHKAPTTGCTHLYTTGGIFPVDETPEQIDTIIEQLNRPLGPGELSDVKRPTTV